MDRAHRKEIVSVADARRDLSKTLRRFRLDPNAAPIVLGSHRKPEAVLVSYDQFIAGLIPVARPVTMADIREKAALIHKVAELANVWDLAIFGSVARGEQQLGSNVDLLVTAGPGVSHFDIVDFEADLEELLGTRVDVLTRAVLDTDRQRSRAVSAEAIAF
jgi:predicted nucleotidyltransferase